MNVILTRLVELLKFGKWNVVYLLANSVNTSAQQPARQLLPRWPRLWRGTRQLAARNCRRPDRTVDQTELASPRLPPLSLLAWTRCNIKDWRQLRRTDCDWDLTGWNTCNWVCLSLPHTTSPHLTPHATNISHSESRTQKTTANSTFWEFVANI